VDDIQLQETDNNEIVSTKEIQLTQYNSHHILHYQRKNQWETRCGLKLLLQSYHHSDIIEGRDVSTINMNHSTHNNTKCRKRPFLQLYEYDESNIGYIQNSLTTNI
jgi:hypothetical protein